MIATVCALVDSVQRLDVDAIAAADAPALWVALDRAERVIAGAKTRLASKVEASGA